MTKKSKPEQTDLDVFHDAMKDAKPVKQDKIPLKRKTHCPSIKPSFKEEPEEDFLNEDACLPTVSGEKSIAFAKNGISDKTLRKLRKGQYNVDAVLDLHNMTVSEANSAVGRFMRECTQHPIKVALIIHGKGYHSKMPVLKNKLNNWLRHLPCVLAFCTATSKHGGQGAVYVLLKQDMQNRRSVLEK